eukprot:CAMPEP_0178412444 /NCGR_PEP_ID=MMETSP0689_2-20121128/22019_1 /TAXON_ID=160604 /ORGANISM="Amphidinium massartii, Strain CS-259" /LENGTH=551 /DNA_ID=CAMNT_0020033693 /DNA_START=53 /DNA_END=1705 /DNA_ORIENTATION=-
MPSKDEKLSFFESLYAARDADAHQIAKGLFLGTAGAAEDKRAMQKRAISHVLIVHPALPEKHPKDFAYLRIGVLDEPGTNLLELLPDALAFMGKAKAGGRGCFVHCAKGISRSASVVIAYLMLERGLSFEEAWKLCEEKRPIVYPNVGFQIQLRHLEKLMSIAGLSGSAAEGLEWADKVQRLRKAVPKGNLDQVQSAAKSDLAGPLLSIREEISEAMHSAFSEVEALTEKTFMQPVMLQKREVWKRHGLYFENLHKYGALPRDKDLLARARTVSEKLNSLPKAFSDALKGVKLATAVAKEIDSWVKVTEPKLLKEEAEKSSQAAKGSDVKADAEIPSAQASKKKASPTEDVPPGGLDVPAWVLQGLPARGNEGGDDDSSSDDEDGKGKKKKKKDKKKKEKDEKKKEKADSKKMKKAKKAEKLAAEMQKVADEAEQAAKQARSLAEQAAKQAEKVELDIQMAEAREAEEQARSNPKKEKEATPKKDRDESEPRGRKREDGEPRGGGGTTGSPVDGAGRTASLEDEGGTAVSLEDESGETHVKLGEVRAPARV